MKYLALIVATLCSFTLQAQVTTRICVETHANYTDNGFALSNGVTEDHWLADAPERMAGARYRVYAGSVPFGSPISSGYLGDGLGAGDPGRGCSPSFQAPSVITVRISTYGQVQGNFVYVYNTSNSTTSFVQTISPSLGGVTLVQVLSSGLSSRMLRIYNAASFSLFRHAGGMTGQYYRFYADKPQNLNNPGGGIDITMAGAGRKYTIVHELGHRLLINKIGYSPAIDLCLVSNSQCPASAGNHSMGSKETSHCAMTEGFAHFYAADVWNRHDQRSECVFRYYKQEFGGVFPTINCEGGSNSTGGSFPNGFLTSQCSSPFGGYGTELDWMRQFWDVHTDSSNNSQNPTFTAIVDWIAIAWVVDPVGWQATPVPMLDDAAEIVGGTLESQWFARKSLNDIQ